MLIKWRIKLWISKEDCTSNLATIPEGQINVLTWGEGFAQDWLGGDGRQARGANFHFFFSSSAAQATGSGGATRAFHPLQQIWWNLRRSIHRPWSRLAPRLLKLNCGRSTSRFHCQGVWLFLYLNNLSLSNVRCLALILSCNIEHQTVLLSPCKRFLSDKA